MTRSVPRRRTEGVRRVWHVFTLNPASTSDSDMWRIISKVRTRKQMLHEVRRLENLGVNGLRVTTSTTRTLIDTVRGVDKLDERKEGANEVGND